ncbi:MAG: HAMP domain-containing sensor histidine kinase [Cyanobacteria bacterium P01_G01_bin.19]
MQNWLLQDLSDVLNQEVLEDCGSDRMTAHTQNETENRSVSKHHSDQIRLAQAKAEREWHSAIASVENLLLSQIYPNCATNTAGKQGLIFSAPVPLLSNTDLVSCFQSAVFTTDVFNANALMPCGSSVSTEQELESDNGASVVKLPLIPKDPIALEPFCLILTANFGLIMLLGKDSEGIAKFHFSFCPLTIGRVWATLRSRLVIANYRHLSDLDCLVENFASPEPSYRLVTSFTRQLIENLPANSTSEAVKVSQDRTHSIAAEPKQFTPNAGVKAATSQVEMELLQALTHEVRTPLTTIRTLTKLLLKRKQDFKPNVVKRLQTIDRECTEQIERMELIFRAAELESTNQTKQVELVPFSLEQVFQQSIPRWQEKAQRRNVKLEFTLPEQLPKIVSDPVMLDTVLTGLMESCTRSLPTGGHIDVKISTAGDRLKLRVLSQASNTDNPFKSLGQLLSFQPATGCLSLNLDVTKNIFQALGGKLTVRQRQAQGKELTIFLPLGQAQKNSHPYSKVAHS